MEPGEVCEKLLNIGIDLKNKETGPGLAEGPV